MKTLAAVKSNVSPETSMGAPDFSIPAYERREKEHKSQL